MIIIEAEIKFLLTPDQLYKLQLSIYSLISEEIHKARCDSYLDRVYLSKKDTCHYLNIANNTLDKWVANGLPKIEIGGVIRFDKRKIDEWLSNYSNTD